MDLKNLLGFLSLRCDSHAQLEIRSYANVIAAIVKEKCPLAFEAWYDYIFTGSSFTRLDILFLEYINDTYPMSFKKARERYEYFEDDEHKSIGMNSRELDEFWDKISPKSLPKFELDFDNLYEVKDEE